MKPVVEYFEIRQNQFSRWMFLMLNVVTVAGFMIIPKTDGEKWIVLAGIAFLGGGLFASYKVKITVWQEGFEIRNLRGTKLVAWTGITALRLDMVYHGHGAQEQLTITAGGKTFFLHPKQFQAKPMQRFIEVLNEQCGNAVMNVHFLRQAKGEMNWRNKLKMF